MKTQLALGAFVAVVLIGGTATFAVSPFRLDRPMSWRVTEDTNKLYHAASSYKGRSLVKVEALPIPIQRHFTVAIGPNRTLPIMVETNVAGMLSLPGFSRAMPAAGREILLANPAAMLWDINITFNPLVTARVTDRYIEDRGSIHTNFFSVFNYIDEYDVPELNKTQAIRWLGLGVMLPSIFLNPAIKWQELDDQTARASLMINDQVISQDFFINDDGLITAAKSEDRYERYGKEYKRTGSIMHRYAYEYIDGIAVPKEFTIVRIEPDGSETEFWVGKYSDIEFRSSP